MGHVFLVNNKASIFFFLSWQIFSAVDFALGFMKIFISFKVITSSSGLGIFLVSLFLFYWKWRYDDGMKFFSLWYEPKKLTEIQRR